MNKTENQTGYKHRGPHLGMLAIIYTVLFIAGLSHVISFSGGPHFPGPWESGDTIAAYFKAYPNAVLWCASLQFGAAIPLGIYAATVASRFQFLGVRVAGVFIALFGGFLAAFNIIVASQVMWAMSCPGVAQNADVVRALYYVSFALGGVGFSVPFGLLLAGMCIISAFRKLLPKWLIVPGLLIAIAGEFSFFDLLTPKALMLIPLARFPGFIWLIVAGFMLPDSKKSIESDQQLPPL
jgi:hypothetical protein